MNNFRKLEVWQLSMKLTVMVYKILKTFPKNEEYGLNTQIKRCAISIPSNIAEGAGRNSMNEFRHFLSIANGSSYELETQLLLSEALDMIASNELESLLDSIHIVQKMNYKLQKTLQ